MEHCEKLKQLLDEQRKIIERHIDEHKWYHHFADRREAILNFIEMYGWLMRETFCDLCEENQSCEVYREYLGRNNKS